MQLYDVFKKRGDMGVVALTITGVDLSDVIQAEILFTNELLYDIFNHVVCSHVYSCYACNSNEKATSNKMLTC